MVYTAFKDAYLRETVFGTSIIPIAATTTYTFGAISQESMHPSPVTTIIYAPTATNVMEVGAGELWKAHETLEGLYGLYAQNGILLQAVMGKSTTPGGGPPHTHTIVPQTATAGVLPPLDSFTIQHERTGSGSSDWATQFLGCKVANLRMMTTFNGLRSLAFLVDWVAKSAEKVAFVLDDSPILPTTANKDPYLFANMTFKFNTVAVDGLTGVELSINPGLQPEYTRSWTGATDDSRQPYLFSEAIRKDYTLKFTLHSTASTYWEQLIATGNTGDFEIKWVRGADDYILCDLTDCQFISHEIKTPEVGSELVEEIICKPRQCAFEVKDAIAGGFYGE